MTSPAFGAIFDWDGVIADSSMHHERSWELLALEEGRVLPPGHFKQGFGQKNERIIPGILGWTSDPVDIERLSLRKEELYREVLARGRLTILPGAIDLLTALQDAGIACAVGSSTHRANLDAAFAQVDIEHFFTAVVTGEDVSRGKPDPEVFLIAARRIGMRPEQCVVFEDVPAGVEAACRGGMRVVGLTTTTPAEAMRRADRVVGTLADVNLELLRSLFDTPR